ncbi:MAG: hypothetical protein HY646_03205 [Acidobacteria bacterium]|nr:hypothetical protein [Acidobacteriota bacterium]
MNSLQNRCKLGLFLLCLLVLSLATRLLANSAGPPLAHTGDFGQANCNTTGCHLGNPLNVTTGSLAGSLTLSVPAEYEPGKTYMITVTLNKPNQRRWGFELSARADSSGAQAGILASTNLFTQVPLPQEGIQYITHTFAGTYSGDAGPNSWTFNWTAPSSSVGVVRFSCAGNAANNDGTNSGDFIYTTTAVSNASVSTQTPSLTITMSKSSYVTGDTITATEFRVKNPATSPIPVKLQVWVSVPGIGKIYLVDIGADGSFSLPPNLDVNVGTVSLITITSTFPPRGTWDFSSRIENPTTGALLSEDLNPFTVQ